VGKQEIRKGLRRWLDQLISGCTCGACESARGREPMAGAGRVARGI